MELSENNVETENIEETIELTEDLLKLNEGKKALEDDQIPLAIISLKSAVELNPELYEAAFLLGEAYIKYEDYENSVDAFSKSGNYDLSKLYDYMVEIAPKIEGITFEEIIKALPQDFTPLLKEKEKEKEEAERRTQEAIRAAAEEERKKIEEKKKKEEEDPIVPMPNNREPYLTNSFIPGFLSLLSMFFWGSGYLLIGNITGAIGFGVLWGVFYKIYMMHEALKEYIENLYLFSYRLGFEYRIFSYLDENAWSIAKGLFFFMIFIFSMQSLIGTWQKASKLFLSGFVMELKNGEVWVNIGYDHYLDIGDKFRIYKRTKYLKTVKGDAVVTQLKDKKSVVEVRPFRNPETNELYEISIGDVIRK